jgi:hypothetical protein
MVIGQRLRSPGKIFRRGDMPRFALPWFHFMSVVIVVFLMFSIFIILQNIGPNLAGMFVGWLLLQDIRQYGKNLIKILYETIVTI